MAFVRKKKVDGKEYYQLVENYREDGKIRQRMLVHLGRYTTAEAAIEGYSRSLEVEEEQVAKYQPKARAQEIYEWLRKKNPECLKRHGGEVPRPRQRKSLNRDYWFYAERAEESERRIAKYRLKLDTLRALMESGKVKPDPPEVREAREQVRLRALAEHTVMRDALLGRA